MRSTPGHPYSWPLGQAQGLVPDRWTWHYIPMSNCTACIDLRSCRLHADAPGQFTYESGSESVCSLGCCGGKRRRVRSTNAPAGVVLGDSVGRGVMGANFATYAGEEWVAKSVPVYKQRREVWAAKVASDLGVECPQMVEFDGWVLSKRIPQVSHEVQDRLSDSDFIMWLARVAALDGIIGNYDRHVYNILLTPSGYYVIDHERTRPYDALGMAARVLRGRARTAIDYSGSGEQIGLVQSLAVDVLDGWVRDGSVAKVRGADWTAEMLATKADAY